MSTYETVRLINTILTLYYLEELTQTEIAQRLGFSTAKVNRLLLQAREQGYVTYHHPDTFQQLFELEDRLKAVFGLQDAIVIPAVAESGSSPLNALGNIAAEFLLAHLRDGDVLGIGGGTAINAVIQAIGTVAYLPGRSRATLGAVQGEITTDVNYLATHLAERLGAKVLPTSMRQLLWIVKEHCEALRNPWDRSRKFWILPAAQTLLS